jgi:hypothetical protein
MCAVHANANGRLFDLPRALLGVMSSESSKRAEMSLTNTPPSPSAATLARLLCRGHVSRFRSGPIAF